MNIHARGAERISVGGVLLFLVYCSIFPLASAAPVLARAGSPPATGVVAAVFDGDTILLRDGHKVRYLGIDAPEVRHGDEPADCFGDEARKANADYVLHQRVSLRYGRETVDGYGRLIAFVLLPDGRCVNAEMIRRGLACVFRASNDDVRVKEFIDLQREAVRDRRGMWGGCPVKPSALYVGNRKTFVFHRSDCSFGRKMSLRNRVAFRTRWAGLEEGYRPARCCKP